MFIKLQLPAAQAEIFAEDFTVIEKLSPGKFFLKEEAICQKIGLVLKGKLGLDAYYQWTPFEKKENILKGLTIVPGFRWWRIVATSWRMVNTNTITPEPGRTKFMKPIISAYPILPSLLI